MLMRDGWLKAADMVGLQSGKIAEGLYREYPKCACGLFGSGPNSACRLRRRRGHLEVLEILPSSLGTSRSQVFGK